jgi:hypothetical protein
LGVLADGAAAAEAEGAADGAAASGEAAEAAADALGAAEGTGAPGSGGISIFSGVDGALAATAAVTLPMCVTRSELLDASSW